MSENTNVGVGMSATSTAIRNKGTENTLGLFDTFQVECYDKEGQLKWSDIVYNSVTHEGLDYALEAIFRDGTQYGLTDWFVGLIDASPTPNFTDTGAALPAVMSVTEYSTYDETTRVPLILDTTLSGSGGTRSNNNPSPAVFTINGTALDIGGCFICAGVGAAANVKESTATVLYGAGAFTGGNKVVDAGDTLNVTVTVSAAR